MQTSKKINVLSSIFLQLPTTFPRTSDGLTILRSSSRKLGLTALHVAAFFGESEATRELLGHIPANVISDQPASLTTAIDRVCSAVNTISIISWTNVGTIQSLASERGLTPLHLASFSGSEDVVRILLNSAGVSAEAESEPSGLTPLHLACLSGHVGVVGLLLSRNTAVLKVRHVKRKE